MRSVSIAIWTSGEPVSVSCLPNDFVACCFASLVRAMCLLGSGRRRPSRRRARKTRTAGAGSRERVATRSSRGFSPSGPAGGARRLHVAGDLLDELGLACEGPLLPEPVPELDG